MDAPAPVIRKPPKNDDRCKICGCRAQMIVCQIDNRECCLHAQLDPPDPDCMQMTMRRHFLIIEKPR